MDVNPLDFALLRLTGFGSDQGVYLMSESDQFATEI